MRGDGVQDLGFRVLCFLRVSLQRMAGNKMKQIVQANEDAKLALQPQDEQLVEEILPTSLLKVVQGPLLSNSSYTRAVEAAVTAVKRGITKEICKEWLDATLRLLQSRSNPPLALFWAFVAVQKCSLVSEGALNAGGFESIGSQLSVAQSLLHLLKLVTAGFCGGPAAIAAAAPVVQIVVQSLSTFSKSARASDVKPKIKKKLWGSLHKVISELSGFITLCHHKDTSAMHGLFKAPSATTGLDIWLSQTSEYSSLFPFAIQLKLDGFLNPAESVLHFGEIVEIEVALLRLIAEIVHERVFPNSSSKDELEKKLKHNIIMYAKLLGSSTIILDMLLDPPLQLSSILSDNEEAHLRNVLSEIVVVGVPNSKIFIEDIGDSFAGAADKDGVSFLKRIVIARQLAATFRSQKEYLRASDLLAGLYKRKAPSQLGEWLGATASLKVLIGTPVLQKPQALMEWLVNARNADFNVVLDKTCIERLKNEVPEDVAAGTDIEQDQHPDETLFFIDTSKSNVPDVAEGEFDADHAYLMAVGSMQGAVKENVLFQRSEQLERKRTRVAAKAEAAKLKQRRDQNGAKLTEQGGEPTSDSEDISMSEDESDEESNMSQ